MQELEGFYSIEKMADYLGVTRQSYWRWKTAGLSKRALANEKLKAQILKIFNDSERRYGYRRVARELLKKGSQVCKKRVSRLMNELGLVARARKKFKITTDSQHGKSIAPDLLKRDFEATAPNQKWVTDITYLRTRQGWIYLCVIMDLFSKKIVGWSMSRRLKADLVARSILMAARNRQSIHWSGIVIVDTKLR
jgi:transposase InsO family protein